MHVNLLLKVYYCLSPRNLKLDYLNKAKAQLIDNSNLRMGGVFHLIHNAFPFLSILHGS